MLGTGTLFDYAQSDGMPGEKRKTIVILSGVEGCYEPPMRSMGFRCWPVSVLNLVGVKPVIALNWLDQCCTLL